LSQSTSYLLLESSNVSPKLESGLYWTPALTGNGIEPSHVPFLRRDPLYGKCSGPMSNVLARTACSASLSNCLSCELLADCRQFECCLVDSRAGKVDQSWGVRTRRDRKRLPCLGSASFHRSISFAGDVQSGRSCGRKFCSL
jgi:hypothetical protein